MGEIIFLIIGFGIVFGIIAAIAHANGEKVFDLSQFFPEVDRHTSVSQETATNYGEFVEKGVLKLKSRGPEMNLIMSINKQKSVPGMGIRYDLCFMGTSVSKIQLSPKLLKEAKLSEISKYLKNNTIEVSNKLEKNLFDISIKTFDVSLLNASLYATYPDYDKCKEIKKWLCGK